LCIDVDEPDELERKERPSPFSPERLTRGLWRDAGAEIPEGMNRFPSTIKKKGESDT
jgi:hypothetical protein